MAGFGDRKVGTAMILAGDVGGTKTLLALYREADHGLLEIGRRRFASRSYGRFEDMLAEFLAEGPAGHPAAACFAVAGLVVDGAAVATNLPWRFDEVALAEATGASRCKLLNDVEAGALGMLRLDGSELAVLNPGDPPDRQGNIAVVAAGTGLGEAILYWDGAVHQPIATEGGHTDFAPHTDREYALLGFLRSKYGGHVSYERVLSGPGLHDMYRFLRSVSAAPEPGWLTMALETEDSPAVIARAGLADRDPVCAEALDLFTHIYGVEAGNLALKCLAFGGLFLGGGIAPKILPALKSSGFMRGFADKGRFAPWLRKIRVCVALNPEASLIGAAHFACRLAWPCEGLECSG